MFMNLLYVIMLVVTNTLVQANGNKVILLINMIYIMGYCLLIYGKRPRFQFVFYLN